MTDDHPRRSEYDPFDEYGPEPRGRVGEAPTPSQQRRRGRRIVAVVVVLAVIGVTAIVTGAVWAGGAPQRTARAYFDAIVEADAATALSLVAQHPRDPTLLTDDLLRRSQELAPTTDLDFDSFCDGSVYVSWRAGGVPKSALFELAEVGGGWKMEKLADVRVAQSVVPFVTGPNGVPARQWQTVELFPGTYELDLVSDRFELAAPLESAISVTGNASGGPTAVNLSDVGSTLATAAVDAYLDGCVSATGADPSGCPQQQVQDATTVAWSWVSPPAYDVSAGRLDDRGRLAVRVSAQMRATYRSTGPPASGTKMVDRPVLVNVVVDLTAAKPVAVEA